VTHASADTPSFTLPQQCRALLRPNPAWYGVGAALGLTLLGVNAIDTVAGVGSVGSDVAHKQGWLWLPAALIMMVAMVIPHPRYLGHVSYLLFAATLAVLAYMVIPGAPRVPTINGARAWLDLGFMNFQPAELAKLTFIMSLAWYLRYRRGYRTLKGLLIPFLIMFVPVGLILKQPDLGSALVFAPTLFIMLLAAGAKLRHMFALLAIGVVVLALIITVVVIDPPHERGITGKGKLPGWTHVLASHQEKRIAALIWPKRYENREAFQQITATRLAGAGGIVGVGKERATTLVRYNRLPEPHNDMIFAVIVCRWGLLGGLVTLGLYLVLISSFLLAAARSKDPFARLCLVGFGGMIFTQASINIGVTVGILPVTGITLPMISYGGSSLLFTFAMVGMLINFASRRPQKLARPSFEFDNADAIFQ
jgi:cell division protein FtsW (lipid II flippase)